MYDRIGHIITFYSYKGGVGRTLALADVGVLLAQWGFRVLCIDWDLEAPGLDYYYRSWLAEEHHEGLVELFSEYREGAPLDWKKYVERVDAPDVDGRLELVRAGRVDASYASRVHALDWDDLYAKGMGRAIEDMRKAWEVELDFVLIDSRTGLSDMSGICTIQMPSLLVALFSPNDQSIDGTLRVARAAQEKQAQLPVDRARLMVIPVPTRLDNTEYEARRRWMEKIGRALGPFVEEWLYVPQTPLMVAAAERPADRFLAEVSVPYVPYWSYGEGLAGIRDSISDRLGIRHAHDSLGAILASGLESAFDILTNREKALADLRVRARRRSEPSGNCSLTVPLEPGSYDVWQGREMRAFAYVMESGAETIQRWILRPAFVRPPNGPPTTITERLSGWSNLRSWTSFAETELESSGTLYVKAIARVYSDINEAPADPSEQLDEGACRALRNGEVLLHSYPTIDPSDANHTYERFVVLRGYGSGGFATTTIEAEGGVRDLETFLRNWRDNWPVGATFAVVESNYHTALPGSP